MTQKILLFVTVVSIALVVSFYSTPTRIAHSQGDMEVECGQIVEREFTNNAQEHVYLLTMAPRESFEVSVKPFGGHLKTVILFYGPSGIRMGFTDGDNTSRAGVLTEPSLPSGILSARGQYKIRVTNAAIRNDELVTNDSRALGGVGLYTLSIGCTTSDGEKIVPSNNPLPTATPAPLPTPTPRSALPDNAPTFAGVGFPGLAPVDMSTVARVPLPTAAATYGVSPLDNQIYGFVVDAEAGDTLDLSYTRESGNMNLGLVVLSESNEVFFQASLVTSESLSTRFTLPEAGQYTIGIFRISLVEPTEPEPTLFQIKGVVTPTE